MKTIKRKFCAILCAAVLVCVLTPTASAATFSDVSNHWAASYIIKALLEGCGTLDQLGRGTREKIKKLLSDYVKAVKISREQYEQMVDQVKGYASGKIQTTAMDQDQPPPQEIGVPAWIREAEKLASQDMPTLEQTTGGAERK